LQPHSSRRSLGFGSTIAAVGWMGLIFYFSSLSGDDTSRIFEAGAISWLGGGLSYIGHVLLYAVLAALIQFTIWGWGRGPRARSVIVVVMISLVYAITDEYHQSFVNGRAATAVDILVDTAAAAAAAVALWLVIALGSRGEPA
jgi:VanZ family protein